MTNPQTEIDTPWKDILQLYFQEFILFFFPTAHGEIDWTRAPEFLDKAHIPHPKLSQSEITEKRRLNKSKKRHLQSKKTFE